MSKARLFTKLHSLRVRIAVLAVLAALTPIAVFHFLSAQRATDTLVHSMARQLEAVSVLAAAGIDRFFQQRVSETQIIALAHVLRTNDRDAAIGYLSDVVLQHEWINDIDLIDLDGMVTASSGEQNEVGQRIWELFPSSQDLFRAVLTAGRGEVFISDVQWLDTGPGLLIAVPVLAADTQAAERMLFIEINLQSIEAIISKLGRDMIGHKHLTVIDHDGQIIGSDNPNFQALDTLADLSVEPSLLDTAHSRGNAIYRDNTDEDVIAGFAHITQTHSRQALDWAVVAIASVDQLTALAKRDRLYFAIIAGVVAVIALILALIVSRNITKPLSQAVNVAEAIHRGDYSLRLSVNAKDEIGALADTVNSMADRVEERNATLIRVNEELRQEVHEHGVAEQALKRSEARTRAIVDAALDCIITMDQTGNIVGFNPAAEACFGHHAGDVIGQPLADLIAPKNDHETIDGSNLQRLHDLTNPKTLGRRLEVDVARADGSVFPAELAVELAREGEAPLFIAYLRDITSHRRIQQVQKDARVQAEQANRAKSEFLAMMSHEIRTPLNGVLGVLGLLEDTEPNAEQEKYIRTGRNSAESLLGIINDILDFSKMEAGKFDIENVEFELSTLASSVVELLAQRAAEKSITLDAVVAPGTPDYLIGDFGRLRQILVNLVGNAVKFTNTGGIKIEISADADEVDRAELRFQVIDTGIGIAEQHHKSLFTKFTTLAPGYTQKYGGTGLGLAICKRLVELMGGKIGVSSAPSEGSTFWFTVSLAVQCVDEQAARAASKKRKQDASTLDAPRSGRLLLAEDNTTNAMIARIMLEKAGYKVDLAANGLEAVEAIRIRPYDLVIMDIGMPEMDGIDATAVIRDMDGPEANIPIVAMTAHVMSGDREKILATGMDAYLTKPIVKEELFDTLRTLLPGDGQASGTQTPNNRLEVEDTDADGSALFDISTIEKLTRDTGPEILPQLIESFLSTAQNRGEQIAQALDQGDFKSLEDETHALGSSAASFGAMRLANLARSIEHALRDQDIDQAVALAANIPDVAKRTHALLANYLTSVAAS